MVLTAILMVLSMSFIVTTTDHGAEGKILKATLAPRSELRFSYDLQNIDGTATKTGTLTATVTEVEWRGYDSFMFNGSLSGTFWTLSGSGTETGTWSEYYRKGDLAFLDQTYVTDMVIGTNTVTNTTNLHYAPSLTWIEFPLEYENGPEKSIWSTNGPVAITSTWERMINGDDETSESGSDNEALEFDWICANLVKKDVGAGSFDTYWIREWVRDDEPRNQVTDYFYNESVGWWVQKDVYVDDDQGVQVRIKHYELTERSINKGPLIVSDPKITMNEDTTDRSIDLDYVFSDPDGDPLTFKVIKSGILTSSIDQENRLVVKPPKDHYGNESVTVSAQDALNAPVTLKVPVEVRPVDDPPVLMSPSLAPSTGDESTVFIYSITSTDIDTAEPSSAEVRIDSYYYEMTKVSGDNRTGILFQYSTNLEPDGHTYSFRIDGVLNPSSGQLNGPTVTAREDPYLKQGSVSPSEGDVNTIFTFKVTWMGPNGEIPDIVKLILDGSEMVLAGDGGSPVSGTIFSSSMKLREADHSYHFEAALGNDQFRFPQNGELLGPNVAGLEDPYLSGGKVGPEEGGLSTEFTFEVTWTGKNGESPSKVVVVLDGEEVVLSEQSGSPSKGMLYSGTMNLDEGDHPYYFRAAYGNKVFRYPKLGDLDGPTVSSPEMGDCGYGYVSETEEKAVYVFYANYEYTLDVYPTEAKVVLNGIEYDLSDYGGYPATGMNCSREVPLTEGNYSVTMMLVVDGAKLTLSLEDLKVVIDDGELPDDTDGPDDGPDGSKDNTEIIIILVTGIILVLLIAVIIFILMRGKVGQKRSRSESEYDLTVTTSRRRR
jgi:hypothetical protein